MNQMDTRVTARALRMKVKGLTLNKVNQIGDELTNQFFIAPATVLD